MESYEPEDNFPVDIDQDDRLAEKIDGQEALEGLQTLPVDYREALLLRFHEGLSVSEVASALGLSLSAAKMRIHRGLLKLRQVLQEQ